MRRKQDLKYYLAASVSLVTFLVYLSSLQNNFVGWDDNFYVFDNPHIRSFNVDFFRWAFLDFYAANWHPLTWISHALDYAIWGLNPMGHHLTNSILHSVNTFVVVLMIMKLCEILKRTTINNGLSTSYLNDRSILIIGGVMGLLFGLHPLHVESVAWVSERKDLLCALFFLLSIMTYVKYVSVLYDRTDPKTSVLQFFDKRYLLAIGFFILALLSKPMAVSLPFVLLILDWYLFERIRSLKTFWIAFVEKLPFVALSLLSSVITIFAQKSAGAIASMGEITLSTRMLVAAKSLITYICKMILPLNLIPFYPYQKNISILALEYLLATVLVIGITVVCIVTVKKSKLWLSVWICYVVTLIPVLGIVQVGAQSMADRYTYLTSLGPFLVMGLLVAVVSKKVGMLRRQGLILKPLGTMMVFFAFVSMSHLTFEQIGIWKNSITLWSYIIEKEPERVPLAYKKRGTVFYEESQFDKAIEDYTKAIALDQKDAQVFVNRGLAYLKIAQIELAIPDFRRACELGDYFGCNAPKYLLTNGL